jgi:hypothetical protein
MFKQVLKHLKHFRWPASRAIFILMKYQQVKIVMAWLPQGMEFAKQGISGFWRWKGHSYWIFWASFLLSASSSARVC